MIILLQLKIAEDAQLFIIFQLLVITLRQHIREAKMHSKCRILS